MTERTELFLERRMNLMSSKPYLYMDFGKAWKICDRIARWECGGRALWFWDEP